MKHYSHVRCTNKLLCICNASRNLSFSTRLEQFPSKFAWLQPGLTFTGGSKSKRSFNRIVIKQDPSATHYTYQIYTYEYFDQNP